MQLKTMLELSVICERLAKMAEEVREETASVIATNNHVEIIKHYDKVREVTLRIRDSREALTKLEEQLSREWVPHAMMMADIRSTTIEGVGRVSLGHRWSASILDKPDGYKWLREHGHGGIITETVNAQTLGALAKEMNADGLEIPAPLLATNVQTYKSITKVK